ncbi:RNA polymerase sigma factor [Devosia pacifica]|uniref:RNA polymerase sigma factor n=1 Tax=Devosia pacifica TaxID=1335967 RepID=A0A918RY52_9HYPH|nr:sigma-70 family RNA polymerase sigma factor [Devosia pacifica]GHA16888.1 RNA polymerase sigma factor [Devosia pacifica]
MVTLLHEDRMAGLLRAALGGDAVAYESFLRDAAALVRSVARNKLGPNSPIDAEDIVQETLLAIHLKRHTWRTDAPVAPWISTIARHKVIDAFRKRGRRVEVDIAEFTEVLQAEEDESAHPADVAKALAGLTEVQRNVVSAISIDGHSISETSERLGMKQTAVRVALHRGLAAISKRFGKP